MNYVERLIHRALAEPRDRAQRVSDPFERTAQWTCDTPLPLRHAPTSSSGPSTQDRAGLTTSMPHEVNRSSPADDAALMHRREPTTRPACVANLAAALSSVMLAVEPKHDADRTEYGAIRADPAPLATADAFMRKLDVPMRDIESPTRPARARQAQDAPPSSIDAKPRAWIEPARGATPVLRPAVPTVLPPPASAPPSPRRASSRQPSPQPTSAHSTTRTTTPDRTVHTTVVVAPRAASTHRLDDLAHSSGIARFGIGQS